MVEKIQDLSLDDFIRLFAEEGPFELVNGERRTLSPTTARHNLIVKRLLSRFLAYEADSKAGQFFTEAPFVKVDEADWVRGSRVPDVMFFAAERWADYIQNTPDWEDKPFVLIPDLVIEVISPTDRYTEVRAKVDAYLADEVKIVWVIDPRRDEVTVYEGGTFHSLKGDVEVTAESVLPEFSLIVSDLFT